MLEPSQEISFPIMTARAINICQKPEFSIMFGCHFSYYCKVILKDQLTNENVTLPTSENTT
jgi:hypothetical protein